MLRRGPESVDAPAIHTFRPDPLGKREADRYGRIEIDSNRYLADGKWHGGKLLAAAGWDSVRITDPSSGEMIAEYPRRYGGASSTLQDPA